MVTTDRADAASPVAAAVLLHPHPDMGGNRFNNVVEALHRALPPEGITTVRFDFSSSTVAVAAAEVVEALDALDDVSVPRFLVGYSFGGGVAATITDGRLAGWYLVAPALSLVAPTIGGDERPKGIAAAQHDQWFGPSAITDATAGWKATSVEVIAGADHFLSGHAAAVAEAATRWIGAQLFGR